MISFRESIIRDLIVSSYKRAVDSRRVKLPLVSSALLLACALDLPPVLRPDPPVANLPRPITRTLKPAETAIILGAEGIRPRRDHWHPPHIVKIWTTKYAGHTFRVTQLPRCQHLETLITYDPRGETIRRAIVRTGGIAACSGSFHNSQSMALADFLQRGGSVVSPARTGRSYVAVYADGKLDISRDYGKVKRKAGVSAIALGQRLLPLQKDGFSRAFMDEQTDRMAIGLNKSYVFIVQGKSDIWVLAKFFRHRLPATVATNSDGGHVVRGKAPVHIVFRWKRK